MALQHALAQVFPRHGAWDQFRHLLPLGIVGLLSWSVWLIRVTFSRFYRPVPLGYRTTTSVVVPAYREDPDILDRCLRSWLAENPTEVIVVPDLEDVEVIARLREVQNPRLRVLAFAHDRKPSARGHGSRAAGGRRGALCRSQGRGPRDPPERLPAQVQRLAADRQLDDRRALHRLCPLPGPVRSGRLPIRADSRLPALGPDAGPGAHGARV